MKSGLAKEGPSKTFISDLWETAIDTFCARRPQEKEEKEEDKEKPFQLQPA